MIAVFDLLLLSIDHNCLSDLLFKMGLYGDLILAA
jgi:hypothetical protein